MKLLCRQEWKTLGQVEAHLVAKDRKGPGASAILFLCAVIKNMLHHIQILSHQVVLFISVSDGHLTEGVLAVGKEKNN
jgi:hypothetical protein